MVISKIAGIESIAKIRSVTPMVMKDDHHGRPHALAVDRGADLGPVVRLADVDAATQQADDEVLALHLALVIAVRHGLTDRRPDEEGAEDVEDRREVLDDRDTGEDEQGRAG